MSEPRTVAAEITDAQIEAAAKAIATESGDCQYWTDDQETCWKHKLYFEALGKAALEAARGVS